MKINIYKPIHGEYDLFVLPIFGFSHTKYTFNKSISVIFGWLSWTIEFEFYYA